MGAACADDRPALFNGKQKAGAARLPGETVCALIINADPKLIFARRGSGRDIVRLVYLALRKIGVLPQGGECAVHKCGVLVLCTDMQ